MTTRIFWSLAHTGTTASDALDTAKAELPAARRIARAVGRVTGSHIAAIRPAIGVWQGEFEPSYVISTPRDYQGEYAEGLRVASDQDAVMTVRTGQGGDSVYAYPLTLSPSLAARAVVKRGIDGATVLETTKGSIVYTTEPVADWQGTTTQAAITFTERARELVAA